MAAVGCDDLPPDVLRHTMTFLPAPDVVQCARVCRAFRSEAVSDATWLPRLSRDFGVDSTDNDSPLAEAPWLRHSRMMAYNARRVQRVSAMNKGIMETRAKQRRFKRYRNNWVLICLPRKFIERLHDAAVKTVARLMRLLTTLLLVLLAWLFPRPANAMGWGVVTFARYWVYHVLHVIPLAPILLSIAMLLLPGELPLPLIRHDMHGRVAAVLLPASMVLVAAVNLWLSSSPWLAALWFALKVVFPILRVAFLFFSIVGCVHMHRRRTQSWLNMLVSVLPGVALLLELWCWWMGFYMPRPLFYWSLLFVVRVIEIAWVAFFSIITGAEVFFKQASVDRAVPVFVLTGTAVLLAQEIFIVHWLFDLHNHSLFALGLGSVFRALLHALNIAAWLVTGIGWPVAVYFWGTFFVRDNNGDLEHSACLVSVLVLIVDAVLFGLAHWTGTDTLSLLQPLLLW